MFKNSKGFSLLGVMASIAIVGVLILGILEIVKMSTSIQAMSNLHLQIDDQTFQIRAVLRNTMACSLNLAGLAVDATTKTPVTDIRYLATDQISLATGSAIASTSGGLRLGSLTISRDPNIPNIASLSLPYESKLPGLSLIVRKVQLEIQTDAAGKIVKCSSDRIADLAPQGSPIGSPTGTPTGNRSNLSNCEPRALNSGSPNYNTIDPAQLKAVVRYRINFICDNLNYPTGQQGTLLSFKSNPLPSDPNDIYSHGSNYIIQHNPSLFMKLVDKVPQSYFIAGKYFSNLTSADECKTTPEFPSGAGVSTGGSGGQAGDSIVSTANREVCIDGAWISTSGEIFSEPVANGG